MRPLSIGSRRFTQRKSVLLPLPLGPTTTSASPALTVRSIPSRTTLSPKLFLTSSSRTTGVVAGARSTTAAAGVLPSSTDALIRVFRCSFKRLAVDRIGSLRFRWPREADRGDASVHCVEALTDLIRSRRTHKSFGPDPVAPAVLDELLELARWAPKLDRARTLVVASAVLTGDLQQDEEDACATACAIYVVLLAAHARGLAGYWRTPRVLRTKEGREAVGLRDGERFLGLIHLGTPRGDPPAPERAPLDSYRVLLP